MDVKKLSTDTLKELRALCKEQLAILDIELGWRCKPPVQFQITTNDGESSDGVYCVAKYAAALGMRFQLLQRSQGSQSQWNELTLDNLAAQQHNINVADS